MHHPCQGQKLFAACLYHSLGPTRLRTGTSRLVGLLLRSHCAELYFLLCVEKSISDRTLGKSTPKALESGAHANESKGA